MNMNFGTNKNPVEAIKERALEGTYFRDICSGINGTENHGKNLMTLRLLIRIIIAQIFMTLASINIKLNEEHQKDFAKIQVGLILMVNS